MNEDTHLLLMWKEKSLYRHIKLTRRWNMISPVIFAGALPPWAPPWWRGRVDLAFMFLQNKKWARVLVAAAATRHRQWRHCVPYSLYACERSYNSRQLDGCVISIEFLMHVRQWDTDKTYITCGCHCVSDRGWKL